MFYHFKTHKDTDGHWAECIELKGCYTQADNLEKLKVNMEEALNLFLSEPENSNHVFPLPSKKLSIAKNVTKVKVDPSVAFAMLIRLTRLKHQLTLRKMATTLEYKNINSYVKLEKPKSSNPELKTIAKIMKHFKDFPLKMLFE